MGEELVSIKTYPDQAAAALDKGFLEGNGIKAMIKPDPQASGVFMGVFGGFSPMSPWLLFVMSDDIKRAKELLGEEGSLQTAQKPMQRRKRGIWYIISLSALIIALLAWLL